jgi:hypothetical protein
MASTVNDKVSGDMAVRGGKNSMPMVRAKNPKMTKSNTSSAPPVLATRMVQRWLAVMESFRIGSESSSMEIPDIARHNDYSKRTSRRRDVFSHHHVNLASKMAHGRSGSNMMDDDPLPRKVFSFVLCSFIGGYAGYFIVTLRYVKRDANDPKHARTSS